MNTEAKCPECGGVLPADAVQGLCPRCLLSRAQTRATATQAEETVSGDASGQFREIADLFPHLEILGVIGQGGMGVVYKAKQAKLGRLVALKILTPDAARKTHFPERFAREAQALARLAHPGIVGIYDFGQVGEIYFLLMEFVEGASLRTIIQSKTLDATSALDVVMQICSALQYAHDEGVVHRDIKPANILIDKRGRVKIADFGLAKLFDEGSKDHALTAADHVMGTPHYMAPEQIDRPLEVDHRADIYSLGVVFYEMLTGDLPLGRFPVPSRKVEIDVRLDEIVLRTLESSPDLRYQRVGDVKTDVEKVSSSSRLPKKEKVAKKEPKALFFRSDFEEIWVHGVVVFAICLVVALVGSAFLQFRLARKQTFLRERLAEWQAARPEAEKTAGELEALRKVQARNEALQWFVTNRFAWKPLLVAALRLDPELRPTEINAELTYERVESRFQTTNVYVKGPSRAWWRLIESRPDPSLANPFTKAMVTNLTSGLVLDGPPPYFWSRTTPQPNGTVQLELAAIQPAFVREQPTLHIRLRDYSKPSGISTESLRKNWPFPTSEISLVDRTFRPVTDPLDNPPAPYINTYVVSKSEKRARFFP